MTCNTIRHLTVSLMCAVMPDEKGDLADYMCHSQSMQLSTYSDLVKSNKAVRSSVLARKILTNEEITADDLKEPEISKSHLLIQLQVSIERAVIGVSCHK